MKGQRYLFLMNTNNYNIITDEDVCREMLVFEF